MKLYRGQAMVLVDTRAEWNRQNMATLGQLQAEGCWWTDDLSTAEWYRDEAGVNGVIRVIDLPGAEAYRITNLVGTTAYTFSREKEKEFFLPKSLLTSSRRLIMPVAIPGSGKSTYGKVCHPQAVVCATDDWFNRTGEFVWRPEEMPLAQAAVFAKAQDAMAQRAAEVYLDRCNLTHEERQPYLEMAAQHGYDVEYVVFPANIQTSAARRPFISIDRLTSMAGKLQMP